MADPGAIASRQEPALRQILDVLDKHDPATAQQLRWLVPNGGVPNSIKQPHEFAAFMAESLASVVRQLDEHQKPKPKRGRPPKSKARS